jgi:translation elongation factor EF-Tu-like GTPase
MKLPAIIRFLTKKEGGRQHAAWSGYHPQLKVDGELTSTRVITADPANEKFELGVEYKVYLELMFEQEYLHRLDTTQPIELSEGSRLVGVGYFIDESDEN